MIALSNNEVKSIVDAATSQKVVSGLTHEYYRYPARFSPHLARIIIETFTDVGDLVLDPFMGGGTSLVEAKALGRQAIGTDISELATFVSKVKSTLLTDIDFYAVTEWMKDVVTEINLSKPLHRPTEWVELGYQRNISCKKTWPIRKTLEYLLGRIDELPNMNQREFVRCSILKTSQWALDCRKDVPSSTLFRDRLIKDLNEMIGGNIELHQAIQQAGQNYDVACINRSALGLDEEQQIQIQPSPKLILTSPPYPGVHMLYHRWQVLGRRETPAPFWIANCLDGSGAPYYTMGGRSASGIASYYMQMESVYRSLAKISDHNTVVAQVIAFSEPDWQLPKYLQVLDQCGFIESKIELEANSPDGRLWRNVPNRKWYAEGTNSTSGMEVVLFHKYAG